MSKQTRCALIRTGAFEQRVIGTLCEKRHDAVLVMDDKHFISLVSVHMAVM